MSRLLTVFAAALVIATFLSGCGGQSSPSAAPSASASPKASNNSSPSASAKPAANSEWGQIVEKGKKEGKVTVYGAWGEDQSRVVKDAFAKVQPDITVEFLPMISAETIPRLETEQSTGKYVADLFMTGSPSVRLATTKGLVENWTPPATKEAGVEWLFDPLMDKNGPAIHMADGLFIIVNTNLVKAGEEPKSWKELEDPKWKGKILLSNPGSAGPGNRWFASIFEAYGRDHARKVIENSAIYKGEYSGQATEIARGEYAVTLPTVASTFGRLIEEKAPIRVVEPSDGVLFLLSETALIKNAPHSNAAKVFFNFLFTKEGQEAISKIGGTPVRKDVSPHFKEFKVTKNFAGQPPTKEWENTTYVQARPIAQEILTELGK